MSSSELNPSLSPQEALAPVVEALKAGLGTDLVAVVLFGSRARGEADPESDWDLLIIAKTLPLGTLQRHFTLKRLLPPAWRAQVAMLAKTPTEFQAHLPALYLDIALDGIVLYDPEGYITPRLAWLREQIQRRGWKRERFGADLIWRVEGVAPVAWSLSWEVAA